MIVRSDLPLGMLAAQVVHAASETSPGCLPHGTHAVVLGVASEEELKSVSQLLRAAEIPHKPIVENDPPLANQWCAIGVSPMEKNKIYPHLKHLTLLGEERKKVCLAA